MWDENLPGSGKLREALLRGGYPRAEFRVGIPPQAGHLPVVLRGFTRPTLALQHFSTRKVKRGQVDNVPKGILGVGAARPWRCPVPA